MGISCAVLGCKSNYKNVRNNSIFKVPDEAGMLKRWEAAILGVFKIEIFAFYLQTAFRGQIHNQEICQTR